MVWFLFLFGSMVKEKVRRRSRRTFLLTFSFQEHPKTKLLPEPCSYLIFWLHPWSFAPYSSHQTRSLLSSS